MVVTSVYRNLSNQSGDIFQLNIYKNNHNTLLYSKNQYILTNMFVGDENEKFN